MNKQVSTHWNQFSKDYDKVMQKDPAYLAQVTKIVSYVDKDGKSILDLGCGTGMLTYLILSKYPKTKISMVDPADDMLKIAQTRFGAFDVNVLKASAHDMPFDDNSFDYIVTNWALHHLTHELKIVCAKELFRVLKPTGKLILGDQFADVMNSDIKNTERVRSIIDLITKKINYYYENVSFERMLLQAKLLPKFLTEEGECLATVDFWVTHLEKAGFKSIISEYVDPKYLRHGIIVAEK